MERTVYLTRTAYLKSIEDALLEQLERVSSSKEEADKLIASLGIEHLLISPEETVKKKADAKKEVSKKKKRITQKREASKRMFLNRK
jgi:hypothetical protein